ncbi:MAG: SDR family NAD(P)-dependent oxidoreductase [Pigmentiphaga sp.]|nr:SDR family NAD(P)-dependent oxidoreductase [Pigmentiphaga sp.]
MKVAFITGASAGFGRAAVARLIDEGWHVAGAARRAVKLDALSQQFGEHFLALPLDVSDRRAVQHGVNTVLEHWGQIDLLVNNAGLALGLDPAQQASLDHWDTMIATNVNGVAYLAHAVLPHMIKRNQGQIINIGSTAGAYPYKGGNVYGGTKAFVQMFSQNLRADLTGTRVRVTHIAPGLCSDTEFSSVRFEGDQTRAASVYEGVEAIKPEDIANTIAWVASQPEHVNINTIEIMPVAQSFSALSVTRGI